MGKKNEETRRLYRPVGIIEYNLIRESGFKKFPPRLPEQPIFYPVTNKAYAEQIASVWNTADEKSGYAGIVMQFEVDDNYINKFEKRIVGSSEHEEYWIPAEELEEFNSNITGAIEPVSAVFGENFEKDSIDKKLSELPQIGK